MRLGLFIGVCAGLCIGALAEGLHSDWSDTGHIGSQTDWSLRYHSLAPLLDAPKPLTQADGGFYRTGYGLLIHQSCVNKLDGEELNRIACSALREGVSCLWKLGTSSSLDNVGRLAALFARTDRPPKLNCPDDGQDSILEYGYAHSTKSYNQSDHPSIYLGIDEIPGFQNRSLSPEGMEFLRSTLFHELFHNLGYSHGLAVEYPYTCEACCFSAETKSESDKKLACRICRGGYSGIQDPRYLVDISKYADRERSILSDTRDLVAGYVLKHPRDRNARALWTLLGKSDSLKVAVAQALGMTSPALSEPDTKLKALSQARLLTDTYFDLLDGKVVEASRSLARYHIPKEAETPEIYWLEYFRENVISDALALYEKSHPSSSATRKISELIKITFP